MDKIICAVNIKVFGAVQT